MQVYFCINRFLAYVHVDDKKLLDIFTLSFAQETSFFSTFLMASTVEAKNYSELSGVTYT